MREYIEESLVSRPLTGAYTEQELLELQERNAIRVKEAIELMGKKYIYHIDNEITKKSFKKELRANRKLQLNV